MGPVPLGVSCEREGSLALGNSFTCMPAGACGTWVLKLRLQCTELRRGLGMATCRQPEGPSVYRQLSLTCTGWSEGPPQEPHYYHAEGGGCICIGALLSAASRWGSAPVAAEMESLDLPGVGLMAQPTGKAVEPAAMDSVSTHNGWQAASWWQLLRRKRQCLFLHKYWFSSTSSHHSLELDWGASTPTAREQTLHQQGCQQPESKVEAPSSIQCRFSSLQHQTHPLSRG